MDLLVLDFRLIDHRDTRLTKLYNVSLSLFQIWYESLVHVRIAINKLIRFYQTRKLRYQNRFDSPGHEVHQLVSSQISGNLEGPNRLHFDGLNPN